MSRVSRVSRAPGAGLRASGWSTGILVFALAGCSASYTATLTGETVMPDGSSLTATAGSLHTGMATAFTPSVFRHNAFGEASESDGVLVTSSNPSVLRATGVTGSAKWIVWAVAPGSAELSITQDGNVAASIPVEVTDPPP